MQKYIVIQLINGRILELPLTDKEYNLVTAGTDEDFVIKRIEIVNEDFKGTQAVRRDTGRINSIDSDLPYNVFYRQYQRALKTDKRDEIERLENTYPDFVENYIFDLEMEQKQNDHDLWFMSQPVNRDYKQTS